MQSFFFLHQQWVLAEVIRQVLVCIESSGVSGNRFHALEITMLSMMIKFFFLFFPSFPRENLYLQFMYFKMLYLQKLIIQLFSWSKHVR